MASPNITIIGIQALDDKLNRIQKGVNPMLRQATRKAVLYVHSTVPPYPPPPATSTYRRTSTLGRSITTAVREIGNAIAGVIGTLLNYAPYVIGLGQQAKVHKGRWYTLETVVAKARDAVVKIYSDAVNELVKGK